MAVSCGDGWFCNYNFQSELDWTFSRPTEFKIISPHCRLGAHTVLIHAALAATALLRPLWNALKITMQRILFKPGKVQQRVAACKLTLRHPRRPWSEQREWTTQVEKFFYSEVFIILPFLCRKHIRVSKVVVHEGFSTHVNDIALLKLGEFMLSITLKFWF